MRPAAVAAMVAAFRRRRLERVALEPAPHVEVVELLAPQHAGERLALDAPHVLIRNAFLQSAVEGISIAHALREDIVKAAEGSRARLAHAQSHADGGRRAGSNRAHIKRARLGAFACRIDRVAAAVNHIVVERVLEVSLGAAHAEQSREVALVIAEQQAIRGFELRCVDSKIVVLRPHATAALVLQRGLVHAGGPAPDVAEPDLRQHMDGGLLGAAIVHGETHENVVRVRLGVVDVEVFVVVENPGVDQLELHRRRTAPPRVLLEEPFIRIRCLRQLVEHARVGVAGYRIEIVVELLDVLAVIALGIGEAKQPLFQDRIAAVPQREREAEQLAVVAKAGDAILAPAIGASARLVVGEIIPGGAARAIILAHRAPLPLTEIRAPAAPILHALTALLDALPFNIQALQHQHSTPTVHSSPRSSLPGIARRKPRVNALMPWQSKKVLTKHMDAPIKPAHDPLDNSVNLARIALGPLLGLAQQ